jgi:hypothetical protein
MTLKNRSAAQSLPITLAALIALSFAFSSSACELIASVDRSQVDGTGGDSSDGSGGSTSGSGGESSGAGGEASSSGGEASAAGGSTAGGGGESPGSGGDASAGGSPGDTGGSAGDPGLGGEGGESNGPDGKVIYLTGTPKKANFGGISAADAECNDSPPTAGTYKALLVDGTTRVACTSADCTTNGAAEGVDWVLAPNTTYVRADGTTVIGTTTSAAVFSFPLDASIGDSAYTYWTGLDADWTTSDDSCSGWTQTTGYFANEGLADASDDQAITGVNESCATLAGAFFACVEQ